MLLSVLMPALDSRDWGKLYFELLRQAEPYGDAVEILVDVDKGERTSGMKRQRLADASSGLYRAFVDDDDWVSPDYISSLVEGCETGADVVTFRLEMTRPGKPTQIWRFGLYPNDRESGRMCANHLCAWHRRCADAVGWTPHLGNSDDHLWFQPMLASGLAKRAHHVYKVLYHYRYHPEVTVNQNRQSRNFSEGYFGFGLGCFWKGDEILIQAGNQNDGDELWVYDKTGSLRKEKMSSLRLFHTVKI